MKNLFYFLLLVPFLGFSQYSNYYSVNANVNVNKNVNVSGNVNVNKTVTSIDYGALAQANAQRQRNMIEQMKIQNENEKVALLQIAEDPQKAFDYGTDNNWKADSKTRKKFGWKKIKYMYHKIPHQSLFIRGGSDGYTYINESANGVKTELIIYPAYAEDVLPTNMKGMLVNTEKELSYDDQKEGEEQDYDGDGKNDTYLHKKDLNKTKVARLDGFVGTLIFEDKYEKRITDNYVSVGVSDGLKYLFFVKVRYKGDKDEVTFEELEGRRFYFRQFMNKTISTLNYN
jgi:hypothetical protein